MKVLIIDLYNMIHRARYGFGQGDHAVTFNFFRQLKSEIDKHSSQIVYVVDEGRPVQSIAVDSNYKGNRVRDPDEGFHRQKREIIQILKTISGVIYAQHPERECDDVAAHLAVSTHKNDHVTIVSSDSDFIQTLEERDNVFLWNPVKKEFVEKVQNYVIFKALKGDPTDNVPGIPGVGPTKASKLAADPDARKIFLESHINHLETFSRAYEMIKFKTVPEEEIVFLKPKFDQEKLLAEFTARDFQSIIGKSWPKWVKTFGGINVQQ